ncbi:hypothetical protein HAX54_038948 [Datura stramonium]|uniref:Uncharacterized protein n=1 Tax=Datura stramonium TaxID=4076 RepID=A0ABS8VPJ4_DATST|nr:hypothetical protein [Datura stramonium]
MYSLSYFCEANNLCHSSSGSEVHYYIKTFDESPKVTTRVKSKAQEAVIATSPLSQSEEGGEETDSDGEKPHADDAEEGNDDAKESGDDDTEAEESGDKESATEKSSEQVEEYDPATTLEARSKIWFYRDPKMCVM